MLLLSQFSKQAFQLTMYGRGGKRRPIINVTCSVLPYSWSFRSAARGDWSYPEQGYNSATGHFVRLVRSPGTLYHWTFVRHLHYQLSKTCWRHI